MRSLRAHPERLSKHKAISNPCIGTSLAVWWLKVDSFPTTSHRDHFEATKTGNSYRLISRPDLATSTEATVFGGMKSKNIDVVVSMRGIGPVLAVSCKGTVGAYRNLTNRMEEASFGARQLERTKMAAGRSERIRSGRISDD